jgi:dipeptidyl aminopeptidase/acylaminoacyl peptidase
MYLMNPDGSGQARSGVTGVGRYGAAFSSDGSKVVFGEAYSGVSIVNTDGSNQTRLTSEPDESVRRAVFSPDGLKIAYESARSIGFGIEGPEYDSPAISVMSADGSGRTRLTDPPIGASDPVFSPDGSKIAFTSESNYTPSYYSPSRSGVSVMNADGSAPTRLTSATVNGVFEEEPSFSPDGSRIAYTRRAVGKDSEIYVMNADGSGQTRLGGGSAVGYGPVFSPDGLKIAFTSGRDVGPSSDVYVMNADGSSPARLTYVGASVTDWAAMISTAPGVLAPGAPGTTPALCPAPTSASVRCYRQRRRLVMAGTPADERFVGTDAADRIVAFAGNDIVAALGGDDFVAAGVGNDRLVGGAGNDTLNADSGDDSLAGVAGNDRLDGGPGNDRLSGGAGRDNLLGGAGRDNLLGGAGSDRLRGGPARDHLDCGSGRDRTVGINGDRVARTCERR